MGPTPLDFANADLGIAILGSYAISVILGMRRLLFFDLIGAFAYFRKYCSSQVMPKPHAAPTCDSIFLGVEHAHVDIFVSKPHHPLSVVLVFQLK